MSPRKKTSIPAKKSAGRKHAPARKAKVRKASARPKPSRKSPAKKAGKKQPTARKKKAATLRRPAAKAARKAAPKSSRKPGPRSSRKAASKASRSTKAVAKKSVPGKAQRPARKAPAKGKAPATAQPSTKTLSVKKTPSTSTNKGTAARDVLRSRILGAKNRPTKPISFSLDEVRAIARSQPEQDSRTSGAARKATAKSAAAKKDPLLGRSSGKPNHIKAASLTDILGFNPRRGRTTNAVSVQSVPEKYKRYYKLLLALRQHLTEGIELHSEETLKRSSRDDAGDLSAYGQHMADAGTDTFDRDFALSLVSSEQEALTEIDAAIKRIHDGTFGICEVTGKAIARERLLAVPFTRYSAEAQKEIERHRHRTRTQAGLFGEHGDDSTKSDDSGDDD